jgi:hypothetical protein
MTIEIHKPELEALIRDWMNTGAFPTVEDALMQALKSLPLPEDPSAGSATDASSSTGAVVRDGYWRLPRIFCSSGGY